MGCNAGLPFEGRLRQLVRFQKRRGGNVRAAASNLWLPKAPSLPLATRQATQAGASNGERSPLAAAWPAVGLSDIHLSFARGRTVPNPV
jgi:hypothetical protein